MKNYNKLLSLLVGTVLISGTGLTTYAAIATPTSSITDSKIAIMPAPVTPKYDDSIGSVEKNNRIEEDYTYNNTHFYTKKIKIKVAIKDEDLAKYKKVYLVLSQPNYGGPVYYKAEDSTTTQDVTINTDEINKYLIRYDFKDKKIPSEFIITIADIQNKLSSEYGDSLTPEIYAELEGGTEKRLTINNYSSIYLPSDTEQNKYNHLSNLGYTQGLQIPYYYGQSEKLNSIFEKLKEKHGKNYITVLEKLETKVTKLQSDLTVTKSTIVSKIQKESDFQVVVKPYFKLMGYETLYSMILEKIRQELQENMIDTNTQSIFGEYLD